MNPIPNTFRDSTFGKVIEAYKNPRLEDPESDYLNEEHREELRDQSEIVHWEATSDPEIYPVGTIQPVVFVTKQGYGYEGAWGIPAVQQNKSLGLAVGPLGTSGRGYNRHMMLNYMRAGNYVAFKAHEGSFRPKIDHEIKTRISLANTAAALLNFGYHVRVELAKQGHDLDEEDRFTYGASKAGAVALLLNALDNDFAQNIQASDVIAPSPTLKFDSMDHWKQVVEQIVREPVKASFIISRLGLKLAIQYRKSISLDTHDLAHQIEICGGLFNGELDAAAVHIPSDKIIRITEYDCDLACNDGGLEQRLTPDTHPNVSFELLKGIHMSIADRNKTLPIMMGFNKALQEQNSVDILHASTLFDRAKVLAPHQFPITKDQIPTPSSDRAA